LAGAPITFGVSVTSLTQLTKDMRGVSKTLASGFTKAIKAAVQPVVTQARANASFSDRIPGSIRATSTSGKANVSVKVVAGGAKAPEAAAFEHQGTPGTFRHPVFGTNTWVSQAAHPFLFPALTSQAEDIASAVEEAIDSYLTANGL
jgi:hypothetical protein